MSGACPLDADETDDDNDVDAHAEAGEDVDTTSKAQSGGRQGSSGKQATSLAVSKCN